MENDLHVYSANCSWHDHITKVGLTEPSPQQMAYVGSGKNKTPIEIGGHRLPCCPFCGSILFQLDEKEWWEGAEKHDKTHPGYLAFLRWSQGKCRKNIRLAALDFQLETGVRVNLD
jgi:hypothetical protein